VLGVGVDGTGVGVEDEELAPVAVDAVVGVAANHLPPTPCPFT
jgi:hypothetical protein